MSSTPRQKIVVNGLDDLKVEWLRGKARMSKAAFEHEKADAENRRRNATSAFQLEQAAKMLTWTEARAEVFERVLNLYETFEGNRIPEEKQPQIVMSYLLNMLSREVAKVGNNNSPLAHYRLQVVREAINALF